MNDVRRRSGGPGVKTALALAALALCLRLGALSAGPGQGVHYHPDAAKQVRAVQQFLRGDYLVIHHRRNYDGYPLFNSHLVEYLFRIADPPLQQILRLVGAGAGDSKPELPDPTTITWVTLLWNAALSTAAVGLAFVLGRRFGPLAGVLAGALAALSPLDVAAAHYVVGDTAAAFFALATVYAAVRILETGGLRYYVLGALAAAAAFSAKYNAGVAGIAVVVAHLLRHPGRQALFSAAAWRRAAAAAAALALGLVLTSPALLVNPSWTIRSIVDFLAWVANYGLTEAQLRLPYGERLLLSLRGNGLQLVRATSLFGLAGAAAALAAARPRPIAWVIASLPATLLLLTVAGKPVAPAVHLLPAILPLLILAAAGAASLLARGGPLRVRAAGAVLAAGGVLSLGLATRDELFFFALSDTRRIAESWARDSIPATLAIDAGRAFPQPVLPAGRAAGGIWFLTPKYLRPVEPGEYDLARFSLEESSLPAFRNTPIVARVRASEVLARDFDLPLWAPLPSLRDDETFFVDAPVFYRSPLVRDLAVNGSFEATAVAPRPLERCWLVLRAGAAPAGVEATFGGRAVERLLGAGEVAVIPIEHPRRLRPAHEGNHFYRWTGRARLGPVRVALVTDEGTLGRYCFNERLFPDAWRALAADGGRRATPGRRIEQAIAGLASGAVDAAAADGLAGDLLGVAPWDAAEVRKRFGIHPDWLDGLQYLTLAADAAPARAAAPPEEDGGPDPAGVLRALSTPPFQVPPGRYLVEVAADSWTGPLRLDVRGPCGRVLRRLDVPPPGATAPPGGARIALQLPPAAAYTLALTPGPGAAAPAGARLKVRPDVLGTVTGRLDLLRRLLGRPVPGAPDPCDYDALLAAGDQARRRGEAAAATALYREAALADPERRGARERLGERAAAPAPRLAGARFGGGIELVSFGVDASAARPGGSVGVRLQWRLPGDLAGPEGIFCWIHAVDRDGRIVFQGDHPLLEDALAAPGDDDDERCWYRIPIPAAVPPGSYELRSGLWRPARGTSIRLLDAAAPDARAGVSLARVTVAPGVVAGSNRADAD